MNTKGALLFAMAAILALTPLVSTRMVGAAEKSKVTEEKAKSLRGGGEDTNIKIPRPEKVDPKAIVPAPPDKGGKKTRGQFCNVMVDNYTGWPIDIYIDGRYDGSVPARGSLYTSSFSGMIKTYARINFSDGSAKAWGPTTFSCTYDHTVPWRLTF